MECLTYVEEFIKPLAILLFPIYVLITLGIIWMKWSTRYDTTIPSILLSWNILKGFIYGFVILRNVDAFDTAINRIIYIYMPSCIRCCIYELNIMRRLCYEYRLWLIAVMFYILAISYVVAEDIKFKNLLECLKYT